MYVKHTGLCAGIIVFAIMWLLPPPAGMPVAAWQVTALAALMAIWWMTEALPLTVTALLPFVVVPFTGAMNSKEIAAAYFTPIILLVLGGAFLALAIERTGMHRRLALWVIARGGKSAGGLLLAFMIATAILSMFISNTATALIMMPIALAVIASGGIKAGEKEGFAGALAMGVGFAATLGGYGTLVGSPTNAISVGLIDKLTGTHIDFLTWSLYGIPLVMTSVPLCWWILMRVQRVSACGFDPQAARQSIGHAGPWTVPERRLLPIMALVVTGWLTLPLLAGIVPKGTIEDGTIAVIGGMLLFAIPDGTGRPLLKWEEANRAPWAVMLMFGGGLALADAIGASGLGDWMGDAMRGLDSVPTLAIALIIVGFVILITEFASNVAAASGVMPVVAGMVAATAADPMLLALPAAFAASWGFMLPSGTGPNAIAWSTGHVAMPRMIRAGLMLDMAGAPLIVALVWTVHALVG